MKRKHLLLALACLAIMHKAQSQTLLKNATIINGDATIQPRKGAIYINNGKITNIVYGKKNIPTKGYKVIDCDGKYVTPGLTDAHMHLATGDLRNLDTAMKKTDALLLNMLYHGITTVRDMAGDGSYLANYKQRINKKELPAPSIFYAAQFAGSHYWELINRGSKQSKDGNTPWYRSIDANTNIAKAVAEAKGYGATGIKVYNDLTKDQIARITTEANKQGLKIWSHAAVFPAKPMDVAKLSVSSMSHAADMAFDQLPGDTIEISAAWRSVYKNFTLDTAHLVVLLQQMKANGVFLDPTVFHATNNKLTYAQTVVRLAHQVGVQIVVGTDWVYPEGPGEVPLEDEMKTLANKCNLSNSYIIQAATLNAARVIGLKDRGQVMKGNIADLLIVAEDPNTQLSTLFRPLLVIKEGVLHTPNKL
ncbi:imidazolonepropionase-like amidohydrolase [Chitinophaga skermanii]|uniref:Imidazolonepropionase-like amidohydrolase n=1 Tax=Chitinophaga skermanii TaxID=331697 RepID=A0A327QVD1_9BACT|nr:amidohydrolase family protein [Chitinophaga skermanii]RAJ08330.1 imidazolonepropionase-like amidohydrolase [Chitinophaga skermanii]